eukprot:6196324-Pleurochrysis_carterae.AAC.1
MLATWHANEKRVAQTAEANKSRTRAGKSTNSPKASKCARMLPQDQVSFAALKPPPREAPLAFQTKPESLEMAAHDVMLLSLILNSRHYAFRNARVTCRRGRLCPWRSDSPCATLRPSSPPVIKRKEARQASPKRWRETDKRFKYEWKSSATKRKCA